MAMPGKAGENDPGTGSSERGLRGLLDELKWRGMLHQASSGLAARLATGASIKGYNGFDPTGPSLHIGHLVPIFGLLHLQLAGGTPVILVGGGTAMIGDPSDKTAARSALTRKEILKNLATFKK